MEQATEASITFTNLQNDPPGPAEIIPPSIDPEVFFAQEARFIADMTQGLPVSFKPGDGWKVAQETGEAFFDPNFFTEKGYSRSQALFATAHEIDHVVETHQMLATPEGRELYARRKPLLQERRRLHILDNCIRDVADNRRVIGRAPGLKEEVSRLYREKLWPSTDFRDNPKHLQLAYSILRIGMLTDPVQIDPMVALAIEELRHVKGKSGQERDIIKIVTDPTIDMVTKTLLVERYVEPVYERLFKQDKEEKKQNNSQGRQQSDGTTNPETDFEQDYKEFESKMPQAFTEEQIEAAATGAGEASVGERQKTGYEKEQGVSAKDIAEYRSEYEKIQPYIEENRKQYRRIIEERLVPLQRLGNITDEGVIIEPGLAAIAQDEFNRGNVNPMVFRDFEGRVVTEEVPGVFELTGVFDRSASMSGSKMEEQRRAAILLMEALNDFMLQPEIRRQMLKPPLVASSEIRSLGGAAENVIIKPLSPELTEKQRVEVFKVLSSTPGGATEDYEVLKQIQDEMTARDTAEPGYLDRVKRRAVKKLVVIFSDGSSSNQADFDKRRKELEQMGLTIVDYRSIKDGTNFTSHMSTILANALDSLCYTKKRPQ